MARELVYGTYTHSAGTRSDGVVYDEHGNAFGPGVGLPSIPSPAGPAESLGSVDVEFARALKARRTVGKADEKLRLADSLMWLDEKDDGTVIKFVKTFGHEEFDRHVLTFVALKESGKWWLSFTEASKRNPLTTDDLIIFMLKGNPVTEVVEMTTADRHPVTDRKVISQWPNDEASK